MSSGAVSWPGLGGLHYRHQQHYYYWQASDHVSHSRAAWGKPYAAMPGLRRMCMLGQQSGYLHPQRVPSGARP
jgi:hypothetical protein